jgi:hypothetical protein
VRKLRERTENPLSWQNALISEAIRTPDPLFALKRLVLTPPLTNSGTTVRHHLEKSLFSLFSGTTVRGPKEMAGTPGKV